MPAPLPADQIMQHDFTPEQWDRLCFARLQYRTNKQNRAPWWRALRNIVGYTGGTHTHRRMKELTDDWLQAHPSWSGRYIDAAGDHE